MKNKNKKDRARTLLKKATKVDPELLSELFDKARFNSRTEEKEDILTEVSRLINDKKYPEDNKYVIKENLLSKKSDFIDLNVKIPLTPSREIKYSPGKIGAPEYIQRIAEIEGVEYVRVKRYKVLIDKYHLFSWEEILPQAKQILLEYLKSLDVS